MRKKLPNIEAKRRLAVSICNKANISVQFVPELAVPHAYYDNSGHAYVNLRLPSLEDIIEWEFESHHEISHLFPELKFTYNALKLKKLNNIEHTVANILADNLCERARHGEYLGRDKIILDGRRSFLDRIPSLLTAREHTGVGALLAWDILNRETWQGTMPDVDPLPGIEPYLDRFSELKLDERMISLLVSKGDQTDAFYKLIQEVCEAILLPLPPEEEEDLEEKLVEGDGEGEVLEGGSKSIGGEAPSEAGDTPETDGIGSGLEEEEPSDIPEDSSVPSGETEDKKESEKKPEKESRPDDIEKIDLPKEIRELLTKEPEELKKRSGTYTPFSKRKEIIPNYRSTSLKGCIARIVDKSSVSKKIKKFLKIKSKSGYNYGLERGKIHSKNIHRIFSGSDNPRIFKLKNKVELKTDTAVQIMLDCSGSMSGSKYNIGSACCVAISKTLSELRIVHEILGFSEYRCLFTYIFKGFNQNITKDRLISGFASSNIDLKENADGESVLLGAERLNVRKEKHKLMIVLSDGAPCGTYTGDGNWYLREVCKAIESSGIDLIGIGIKTESVKRFYTNHVVVNNISDLDIVLFEALKRNLLR